MPWDYLVLALYLQSTTVLEQIDIYGNMISHLRKPRWAFISFAVQSQLFVAIALP